MQGLKPFLAWSALFLIWLAGMFCLILGIYFLAVEDRWYVLCFFGAGVFLAPMVANIIRALWLSAGSFSGRGQFPAVGLVVASRLAGALAAWAMLALISIVVELARL